MTGTGGGCRPSVEEGPTSCFTFDHATTHNQSLLSRQRSSCSNSCTDLTNHQYHCGVHCPYTSLPVLTGKVAGSIVSTAGTGNFYFSFYYYNHIDDDSDNDCNHSIC